MPWREADFTQHLKNYEAAERAVNNLVSENCSRERLIRLLRAACDPSRQRVWRVFLGKRVPSRQRAERLAQTLTRSSSELRKFMSGPVTLPLLLPLLGASKFDDTLILANMMEGYAGALREVFRILPLGKYRRGFSFRAVWKHVPISLAIQVVNRRVGKIPYSDLAYALEAVAAGYGIAADISPAALRREHQRFARSKTGKAFLSSGLHELLLSLFTTSDTKAH